MSQFYRRGAAKQSSQQFTPDKWRHFPHNLLKSYGAPELKTEDDEYLSILKPYNTEYFTRPSMGLSMLAQTIAEGVTVLNTYKESIFTKDTIKGLSKSIEKIQGSLSKLDNKNKEAGNPETSDVKRIVKWAIKEDEGLDQLLDEAIHASSTMLTVTSQLKGVRVLFRNPKEYAQKVSSNDGSHKKFQKKGKLPEMVNWIGEGLSKRKKTSRKSLVAQLKGMKGRRRKSSSSSDLSTAGKKRKSTSNSESGGSSSEEPRRKKRFKTSHKKKPQLFSSSDNEDTTASTSSLSSSDVDVKKPSLKVTSKSNKGKYTKVDNTKTKSTSKKGKVIKETSEEDISHSDSASAVAKARVEVRTPSSSKLATEAPKSTTPSKPDKQTPAKEKGDGTSTDTSTDSSDIPTKTVKEVPLTKPTTSGTQKSPVKKPCPKSKKK